MGKGAGPLEATRFHWLFGLAGEGQAPFRIGSKISAIASASETLPRERLRFPALAPYLAVALQRSVGYLEIISVYLRQGQIEVGRDSVE